MVRRLSRSYAEPNIDAIASYRRRLIKSIRTYYSRSHPKHSEFFAGLTPDEVSQHLHVDLTEIEHQVTLSLLGAFEARLRIDYAIRCEQRYRDSLSRAFRELHKRHGLRVHLEEQIMATWERVMPELKSELQELRSAMKYRHWLAHGRYWLLKARVERFDFQYTYVLVSRMTSYLC